MPGPLIKQTRVKDPAAIEQERKPRCEVCGKPSHGAPHHIVTVGAGGPDIAENLIQLCWDCHYGEVPAGKLSKRRLFEFVARRMKIATEEVIERVEKALGRGIKL